MALTVTFDTLQNSRLETNGLATRMLRGVVVGGIDGVSTPDPDMIFTAQVAVTAAGGQNYPNRPDLVFVGVSLTGFATNGVSGYAIYETFRGLAASSYVIRNSSYVTGNETDFIPGLGLPIKIGFKSNSLNVSLEPDKVTMRFLQPTRAVTVSGLVYGTPTQQFDVYTGYVNSVPWAPPGKTALPKGYWMIARADQSASKYSGYYTYEATAITKNFQDWSERGIFVNRQTGKSLPVSDSDVVTANARDYKHGYIWGDPASLGESLSGIVRIGGNPIVEFATLFGF